MEHSMQAQDPNGGGDENDLYSYRRGDIPIFNFDEADRVLIATLQELIEALRKLKSEVWFLSYIFISSVLLFVYKC